MFYNVFAFVRAHSKPMSSEVVRSLLEMVGVAATAPSWVGCAEHCGRCVRCCLLADQSIKDNKLCAVATLIRVSWKMLAQMLGCHTLQAESYLNSWLSLYTTKTLGIQKQNRLDFANLRMQRLVVVLMSLTFLQVRSCSAPFAEGDSCT